MERASRSSSSTGLLMLDLDHFKTINDTCGHLAGDKVLREVARRITQVIRSYDFVGRYGGEEFLAVLPGCDPPQALHSAERIRAAIAAAPIIVNHSEIFVTISIGATARGAEACEKRLLAAAEGPLSGQERRSIRVVAV
jgi:diguanylate cyclase (GGDEF)-like protein